MILQSFAIHKFTSANVGTIYYSSKFSTFSCHNDAIPCNVYHSIVVMAYPVVSMPTVLHLAPKCILVVVAWIIKFTCNLSQVRFILILAGNYVCRHTYTYYVDIHIHLEIGTLRPWSKLKSLSKYPCIIVAII